MEVLIEKIVIYAVVVGLLLTVLWIYMRKQKRESKRVEEKIQIAKAEGLYEPVSLHPVVDPNSCIKSGACITSCPEKDILGIRNGRATTINASSCIGHGACFYACPTQAITLVIGTEKRGVDLPHVDQNFETNVPGIYIAGEIGGMGLIRNAVEQGKQAVENLARKIDKTIVADYDLVVIGAGPAGISATLAAKKRNLSVLALEQDSLGGTVYTFPRSKIVMTSPMDLPLYGKVRLFETSKKELLDLWNDVIAKNGITIQERMKVEAIHRVNGHFEVETKTGERFSSRKVLVAIGRRGTPRKLNIPGEESAQVAYRLLEPELISGKKILVVGGGDSAVEAALLLCMQNDVTLSYRKEIFNRIKPKNKMQIEQAIAEKTLMVRFESNLLEVKDGGVLLSVHEKTEPILLPNDLVYIFAGGELPIQFLTKAGINITRKFGEAILKHDK
ncbi:NAD(P)-binding domain-containing protein [Sunxiuqinia sp. sy24]|uniref:NAD(P)-binding domain-containing protein n=1 Tax=Sunxiuqinia sp. sy24 TaxID=3461495 RepID=UPI0040455F16